ncbi:PTS system sorbose subfamily transporter subunit IIB [Heyndrickxia coagulans]|uniref:PTS system sorbose subfamily transporter subunit IIB n=1 Tax=Heyndrickxia coagulans TaxID=1398 RepID=A0A0C5CFG8_HEYCO|nr:PTS system sorbose subfamily transporter subunit IIB [Heyndrickxia coagulans]KYC73350.1 PTS system, mannose-specific IIB component [Heyndrickxia coagulans]
MRIDDRLLHGQVAYGWTSSLGVNVILVVNDEAKNDQMKAMALNLAKPNQVKLYIRGVEESGEIVRKFAEAKKSKVLVLVKNSADALSLAQGSGGAIHSVNVGGMRYSEGKLKLTDLVAVDQQDLENFKKMQELGVELEFRLLPRDKKKTLSDLLKN